ncbi:MAG: sodium-dependent transporter [Cellvibrionaceae bacterium]
MAEKQQEMHQKQGVHGRWRHRWTFILAAVGSAVGLGNIWKFPYIAGENGGGAFVLVYLACIALIGIPIMIAEVLLGRRGRMSPINSMLYLAKSSRCSHWWSGVGYSGALAGLFILSFYSVVAGWAFHYFILAVSGELANIDGENSGVLFTSLLKNIGTLTLWHTVFLSITLCVVAAGVVKGLGMVARYVMPLLFALLVVLVFYSAIVGEFGSALGFLFSFDTTKLTWSGVLVALGHAFFTLSLGMGAIMAYGAYMPTRAADTGESVLGEGVSGEGTSERQVSLAKTVFTIAMLDTLVAILAGLVIFPIVFASPSIEPSAGPGLLFVSLPVAFGGMAAGSLFASVFFFLVIIAAVSSAISMIEPTVAWLVEEKQHSRMKTTLLLGMLVWFVGLGTVFSFNIAENFTLFGNTFFGLLDFLTANIMLPLGGLLIAIFVGWFLPTVVLREELGDISRGYYRWWYFLIRYVSPVLLALVFILTLAKKLIS